MVLYIYIADSILQKITRKCMKYGDNINQKAECTWTPETNEPEKLYYEAQ